MSALDSFKTAACETSAEFVEKKSRFIGYIKPVGDEESAQEFIKEIKKKHADATHNVYAYVLKDTGIARFSDDGEPSGTAGMPVLEVIKREGLCGTVVVVTRYFGGILLGAGGLVRAYAKAAKMAIDAAGSSVFCRFSLFNLTVAYQDYEKISKELAKYEVRSRGQDFGENVTLHLAVREEKYAPFYDFVTDYTNARAKFEITGEVFDVE